MHAIRSNTPLRLLALAASAAGLVSLTGCAGFSGSALSSASSNAVLLPKGSVHGGQAPIVGAHVYVLSITSSGYKPASGSAPNPSVLTSGAPGTSTDATGTYVTTDANGGVSFAGGTCPSGDPEVYLLATGGNPGQAPGSFNSAIALMAVLGPCGTINSSTFVNINEVSTVAAVTALRPFMTDGAHVGTGSSASAITGLANAVKSISSLTDVPSGSALAVTPAAAGGNGTVPQAEINTLANILAPCVNSASSTSSDCTSLFAAAVPAGGGTIPTDSIGAALMIATHPDSKVSTLFALAPASAPYQPTLATAPNDFSIGITYTIPSTITVGPTTLGQPGQLAIDATGNVWTANCQSCVTTGAIDYLSEFGPTGNFLGNFTNLGIHKTQGIAIDSAGAVWSANSSTTTAVDQVTKISSSGVLSSGFPTTTGDITPVAVAIDSSDDGWVTSTGDLTGQSADTGSVAKISPAGTVLATVVTTSSGVDFPVGIAIGSTGNVFVAGVGEGDLLQISSAGAVTGHSAPAGLLSQPLDLALDANAHIWTINNQTNTVSQVTTVGVPPAPNQFENVPGSPYTVGIYQAAVPAIDGAGVVWIANCRSGCNNTGNNTGSPAADNVIALKPDGSSYTSNGINGFQNPLFNGVGTAAIDASGNVWISNSNVGTPTVGTGSITQIIGIATPVVTPIAVASSSGKLGQTP